MTTSTFKDIAEKHFPLLEKYTPVIASVHGPGHPELAEVRDIFADMNSKVQSSSEADLTSEFEKLRHLTANYEAPSDGCEAYSATYEMLEEAGMPYHAS